ncbi:MAG: fumarylacetoacetate hydrolase family protein [Cyclobacteriaceae bacterium]
MEVNNIIDNLQSTFAQGTWVGRCQVPRDLAYNGVEGPHVVQVRNVEVFDLSEHYQTFSNLLNSENPTAGLRELSDLPSLGSLREILENSIYSQNDKSKPYFISPIDCQAIKACGVTFIQSLLERVIEEKAKGDPVKANELRGLINDKIGSNLNDVQPGSDKAMQLAQELKEQGIWSQYLEVGIGKDAEVFTKGQPLSSVGFGAEVGVLSDSTWNNPEPEVVLAVNNNGEILGATLGNDVNLRDYEGRSALLLGEAKDQNGSCSIGPFVRLFDDTFSIETVESETIYLEIIGKDGFVLEASSAMSEISRSPRALVAQAIGKNHQYPDGLVLFCGTMFAPTKDRDIPGNGFTHKIADQVSIFSKHLGILTNWVNTCDQLPQWEFGITALINYLTNRQKG